MILAVDYGTKRIGLALGQIIPHGIGFLDGNLSMTKLAEKICQICIENEVTEIVFGYPIRSQGEAGTHAAKIEELAAKVKEATGLPIHFETEEFTSVEAERILGKVSEKDRKAGKVDELAAVLILEQFLNNKK